MSPPSPIKVAIETGVAYTSGCRVTSASSGSTQSVVSRGWLGDGDGPLSLESGERMSELVSAIDRLFVAAILMDEFMVTLTTVFRERRVSREAPQRVVCPPT